jgi:AI-2 transport protein TqsA
MIDRMEIGPGARFLLVAACVVVVVAGLRQAASILLPFALATFLAILTLPVTFWLKRRGVPGFLAIFLAVMVDVAIFALVILLASQSVSDFQARLPGYVARFDALQATWVESLEMRGIPAGSYVSGNLLNADRAVELVTGALQRVVSLASNAVLVILIMLFILAEATVIPAKFRAVLGRTEGDMGRMAKIVGEVQTYLGIKTLVSLATGLLIGVWAWIMGLDFPILLGMVGFALNFIPTIGSILAAGPGMLLGVIQYGLGHGLAVGLGYLVINIIFGNLVEPTLQGRRLGLSTVVVVLSLLFWGYVWGPIGMFLSVPLTMVVKIMLENTQDLRWVAVLLDKEVPSWAMPRGSGADGMETAAVDGPVPSSLEVPDVHP